MSAIKGVAPELVEDGIKHAISTVGLTASAHVQASKLSGGQRRKLCLCIALVGDSKVVVLDEPTSGETLCRLYSLNLTQSYRC